MIPIDYNSLLVFAGTGMLGLVSGVVGSFAVLRRRALMGDALSHAALPGLCIAFLIVGHRDFLAFMAGAVISGVLGVLFVSFLNHFTRIKEDAAIGIVLSVFFGAGIVLSSVIQGMNTKEKAGIDSYLFGQTAGMIMQDLVAIIVIAVAALVVLLLFYKEFKLLSFDRDFATVQGWPVLALDLAMMVLLVLTTVIGLSAVGVVLMSALLIVPGVSARFWTERLGVMLVLSGIIGMLSGICGTFISANVDGLPAGPVIVLAGSTFFLFSAFAAPRRGILARMVEHIRLRATVARQNLLRSFYEIREERGTEGVTLAELLTSRSWKESEARSLVRKAIAAGHIQSAGPDRWDLTPEGLRAASLVVRSHRLWEIFLIEYADIAPDHVDRDADQIEHVLSADLIGELEAHLRREGRLPAGTETPASPHPLRATAGGAR